MRNRLVMMGVALIAASFAAAQARAQGTVCGGTAGPCNVIPVNNTAYGTTAAEFLLLAPSARGTALGGAFAALATDVSATYYNPAGLAQMEHAGFMASTMNYVAGTKYGWLAAAFPMSGGSRAIGVSVANFGFSGQPVYTVEDPNNTSGEVYSVSETSVGLTYSQQFSDRFSAGLTAKLINDELGRTSGSAIAVDFGTSFHATIGGRPMRASFVVQNLGTNITQTGTALQVNVNRVPPVGQQDVPQEPATAQLTAKAWSLPVMFRVGLAYDLFQTSAGRLSVLGEFNQPNNNLPGFNLGGEYSVGLGSSGFSVAGRLSVTYWPDAGLAPPDASSANYAGFASTGSTSQYRASYGGGVYYKPGTSGFGVGVDYAYRNMGLLGGVSMLSIAFNW
ncbi:MAG TPA: PorV/PorQ family protein [Gemmatimonadales bacterium]|nr:PorV/PorQ family protein [Gemmatimonadales bacterium]